MDIDKDMYEVFRTYNDCIEKLFLWYMNMDCDCKIPHEEVDEVLFHTHKFYIDMGNVTLHIVNDLYEKYVDHLEGIKK